MPVNQKKVGLDVEGFTYLVSDMDYFKLLSLKGSKYIELHPASQRSLEQLHMFDLTVNHYTVEPVQHLEKQIQSLAGVKSGSSVS